MAKNGSPAPRFETDENYSCFITTLPIHPAFLVQNGAINGAINEKVDDVQISDKEYFMIFKDMGFNINGAINGAIKTGFIYELVQIIKAIHSQNGINRIELIEKTGKGKSTLERYLKILKETDLIEYKGSKKTGGYFLTEKTKVKLGMPGGRRK